MNTYGDRLREALRLSKKDRTALGNALDISIQAIGQVIAGKTKALTAENSAKAAQFLCVDHFWLATGRGTPQAQSATAPTWPFGNYDDYVQLTPRQQEELQRLVQAFMAGAQSSHHKKRA